MKRIILLSFLFLIFSCSNDDDDFVPPSERIQTLPSSLNINILQVDGNSLASCPGVSDSSFMIKDNSIVSGAIGQYGNLTDSQDNVIHIFTCIQSSDPNKDFVLQRFGGVLSTINGEKVDLVGRLVINRSTKEVRGEIVITSIYSNNSGTYDVYGNIDKSGSCEIINRSYLN